MTHEALNLWLIEVDRVLEQNKNWKREYLYKFRNLSIDTKSILDSKNKGEHS